MEETDVCKVFVILENHKSFSACITNENIEGVKNGGFRTFLSAFANRLGLDFVTETRWEAKFTPARIDASIANCHDWGHMNLLTNSEFIDGLASFLDAHSV